MPPDEPLVVVIGSINVDTTMDLERLPVPGETLLATAVHSTLGGKGANQAVASQRQGVSTALIGAIGADLAGADARAVLGTEGLDLRGIREVKRAPTGVAHIAVDRAGANMILVGPGANATLALTDADRSMIGAARVVLAQLEVPAGTVIDGFRAARGAGALTILNPAPAQPLAADLLDLYSMLVPNEHEAVVLTGEMDPARAAAALRARCPDACVIVTLGRRGALMLGPDDDRPFIVESVPVRAVDSVAAGDAFCGVLAAALAEGRPLGEAVRRAVAAGAYAVTIPGALPALPRAADVDRLLSR
mgnify:CR=1 FL=1